MTLHIATWVLSTETFTHVKSIITILRIRKRGKWELNIATWNLNVQLNAETCTHVKNIITILRIRKKGKWVLNIATWNLNCSTMNLMLKHHHLTYKGAGTHYVLVNQVLDVMFLPLRIPDL